MINILVGSDLHLPKHSSDALRSFIEHSRGKTHIVLNGDVFDDPSAGGLLHFSDLIRSLRSVSSAPVFLVEGNHDQEMLASEPFKQLYRRGGFFVVPEIQIGPFRFVHGSLHEGCYVADYLPAIEDRTTLVVGHAHRPQLMAKEERVVVGLPCLAKNGVPDATLGFAVCRSDSDEKRSVSFVLV